MRPAVGSTNRLTQRINVDFPAPLRPKTAMDSPLSTSRSTPSKAHGPWGPYRLTSPSMRKSGPLTSTHPPADIPAQVVDQNDEEQDGGDVDRHLAVLKDPEGDEKVLPDAPGAHEPQDHRGPDVHFQAVKG